MFCKAIKELSERGSFKEKGLGDAQDSGVYASHISPRQQERIAKLVGKKCSVKSVSYTHLTLPTSDLV